MSDVSTFWAKFYENNGMCLENKPFASYGQAVCGNGTCNGGKIKEVRVTALVSLAHPHVLRARMGVHHTCR